MRIAPLVPTTSAIKTYEFVSLAVATDGRPGGLWYAASQDGLGCNIYERKKDVVSLADSAARPGTRIVSANLELCWSSVFQPFGSQHSVLLNNGRWLRASYRCDQHRTATAWDIQRIAPLSVEAYGEVVGLKRYPFPPTIRTGYHGAFTEWTCETHHKLWCVECFVRRDAEILYRFAVSFQQILNGLGGEMKMTAAACSMDLWKRRFLTIEIPPTLPEKNEQARACYYGGRTENFKAGTAQGINVYDVNSLYPAVMRDLEVGDPSSYHHLFRTARLYERLEGFGQFTGTLAAPCDYVPPLPARTRLHSYFPTSQIHGSWTFSEVRHALATGASIAATDEIVFARHTLQPFRSFVDTLWALRQEFKMAHDPREKIVKVLLNSLAGKFGQNSGKGLQTLIVPSGVYDLSDFKGCWPAQLDGYEVFLKDIEPEIQSPHIMVLWAAEITAQARVRMHDLLRQADDSLYYTDTDSLHVSSEMATGEGLGELKLERHFEQVTYLAPKEYLGVDERGEFHGVAKGVPAELATEYLTHGLARFERPAHLLEAIRDKSRIGEWRLQMKRRLVHSPCRDTEKIENYQRELVDTFPYPAEVLADLD